jgi:hypothetical protein
MYEGRESQGSVVELELTTRVLLITWCDKCPHSSPNGRGCNHPESLYFDEFGIIRVKVFDTFPRIPDWCPLEKMVE